jgi:hypothetical protein
MSDAPNVIVRPSLLEPTRVVVADENDLVTITIGNGTLRMSYADALRFSQMVRVHAKKAKRFAGDTARHWSLVATLDGEPN